MASQTNNTFLKHVQTRKIEGQVKGQCIHTTLPTEIHTRVTLYRKLMGHLSSVYCVCFDQTGQYIFTGADDHLIKIWSARDGRLLKTLRGHSGEITDMSVNYENRLLASGGMDKAIRIWDLKTSKLLDCLCAHHAMVTSVKFAPYNRHGDDRYLISTSNDGSVIFWAYHVEKYEFRKLKKFQERNRPGGRIVCSSFSPGGSFLACGSSDNFIHVYGFHPEIGPYWISELDQHCDQVDSIQFCNQGFRFITGSQDGTAIIWTYKRYRWQPLKLDMNMQLDQTISRPINDKFRPRVLIVQWSRDDRYVMTSIVDYSIKVWDSKTGKLVHILKEHKHDVYLIESHPYDSRIFISASHDGQMIIWDLERASVLKKFQNRVDPNEIHGNNNLASIYDIKFSPDGNMIAATDSYGYLSLYGNGSAEPYKHVPEQMFFHTDYRALIRDARSFVMDELTHVAPHLMPRPTLVDMNGNPYPQDLQRFVPNYREDERYVISPLSGIQTNIIANLISHHSKQEDEEYLHERKNHSDDSTRSSSRLNQFNDRYNSQSGGECSRYNTRYSTRYSFRSARTNFMPRSRRTRPKVRYYEEEDEEEWHRQPQQRLDQQGHSDSSTELNESTDVDETEDDDATEISETEIDTEVESDDETVIDSEATEIYDTSNVQNLVKTLRISRSLRTTRSNLTRFSHAREPERPVTRESERLRNRKRFRRS